MPARFEIADEDRVIVDRAAGPFGTSVRRLGEATVAATSVHASRLPSDTGRR